MQVDPRLAEIKDCLYRLAVRAFIFHENKVLFTQEKEAGRWAFPGGGLKYGEDAPHALLRKLSEELGAPEAEIKTNLQIVHVNTGVAVDGIPRANLFYRVEIPMGRVRAINDNPKLHWFALSDITPQNLALYVDPSTNAASEFIKVIETQAAQVLGSP